VWTAAKVAFIMGHEVTSDRREIFHTKGDQLLAFLNCKWVSTICKYYLNTEKF